MNSLITKLTDELKNLQVNEKIQTFLKDMYNLVKKLTGEYKNMCILTKCFKRLSDKCNNIQVNKKVLKIVTS